MSVLDHPFYLDPTGVNRPPGPDKHPRYGEFASSGSGVVPVVRTLNGRRIEAYCPPSATCSVFPARTG